MLHFECDSQHVMELIIADRQERYTHVEFVSWQGGVLTLAYIP